MIAFLRKLKAKWRVKVQRMVRLRRLRWVRAECWKAADLLTWLGQENGAPQTHINDAKDALYRAAIALDEREAAESNDQDVPQGGGKSA